MTDALEAPQPVAKEMESAADELLARAREMWPGLPPVTIEPEGETG